MSRWKWADMVCRPAVVAIWFCFWENCVCIKYAPIRNSPAKRPSAFPTLSLRIHQYMNVLAPDKKNGLNKVQSDSRLWDLQTNPALVPWGPGSGINCYISWPSSCCLSQPAWRGSGLARNHGLRTQQYGHFPRQEEKKTPKNAHRPRGGLLSKQDEPCQTLWAPTFHNHFLDCHFSLFGPANRRRWEASWPVV